MIVWTHVVDEHTLGVITLITATHELLQIGFLAWWSQYALRFFGRYQDASDAPRFYRTENAVLLASVIAAERGRHRHSASGHRARRRALAFSSPPSPM